MSATPLLPYQQIDKLQVELAAALARLADDARQIRTMDAALFELKAKIAALEKDRDEWRTKARVSTQEKK